MNGKATKYFKKDGNNKEMMASK